jgi:hypothetical protein
VSVGVLAIKEKTLSRPWLLLHIQKPGHNKYGTSHCTSDHESLVEVLIQDLLFVPLTPTHCILNCVLMLALIFLKLKLRVSTEAREKG